jgi:hypothetical protein
MTERCFSPDDLDRAARLRSDEPGWDHIATCPRCRARIIAYRAFSAPGEIPVEADLPVARTYLSRALDRVVYGGEEIAAEVTPDADGRSGGAAQRGGQHRVGQHHRIWRPALALDLMEEFRRLLAGMVNPDGDGTAAKRIVETIAATDLGERLLVKKAMPL